tara:strand:+ start:21124 stop:22161 length:1038 start_codon:yes stop_codon:yes gene_type:complete
MDDFVVSNLHESRNEWCSRLVSIFTPLVIEGIKSVFNESWKICVDNDEINKYLMTFQNLLSRIPKWNNNIIDEEKKRIIERSGCDYLEDLITCVHIIQLKILTCIRVGNKQKKIDISIPDVNTFVHKVYIQVARKVYSNVYLFEKNITPLQSQMNSRELEKIVQECIMLAIRESIPTEAIIKAYMDEGVEHDEQVFIEDVEEEPEEKKEDTTPENNTDTVNEETKEEEVKEEETIPEIVPAIQDVDQEEVTTKLTFNDMDSVLEDDNKVNEIEAPKTIERLEDISVTRNLQRRLEEESYEDDDDERITISTEPVSLTGFDTLDEQVSKISNDEVILNDVEELPPI